LLLVSNSSPATVSQHTFIKLNVLRNDLVSAVALDGTRACALSHFTSKLRIHQQARSIISQLIDVTNGAEKSGVAVVDNLASDPA